MRFAFERSLLLGDYKAARHTLEEIEARFGLSFWCIESQLLLAEQEGGLNANRTRLSDYLTANKPGWAPLFATFFSERAENTLCPDQYDASCDRLFSDKPADNAIVNRLAGYFHFRANRSRFTDADLFPFLLHLEERHSLIDRYLTYIYVATQLYVRGLLFSNNRLAEDMVYATRHLNDGVLKTLAGLLTPTSLAETTIMATVNDVVDQYTRGRYSDAARIAQSVLLESPTTFELYGLLAKSLIRAKSLPPAFFPEDSLAQRLLIAMYSVLSRAPNLAHQLYAMRKLSYRLEGTSIGQPLQSFHFLTSADASPGATATHCLLQATTPTPRLVLALPNNDRMTAYLSSLKAVLGDNSAIELFEEVARANISTLRSGLVTVPYSRRLKFCAAICEVNDNYVDSLRYYEELNTTEADANQDDAAAIDGMLRCSLRLGRVHEGVVLLARAAARRPTVLPRTALQKLFASHSDELGSDLSALIEWSVLHRMSHESTMSHLSPEDMWGLIDDFLGSIGLRCPTELFARKLDYDSHVLIYFMRYLCVPEVLDSSPWYDSLDDLTNERIAICEWLTHHDPTNRPFYAMEIAELRRAAAMRELSTREAQGKIFVDTERITDTLSEAFIDRIERCLAYTQQLSDTLRQTLNIIGVPLSQIRRTQVRFVDASFDMFTGIFTELSQQFISSNEWGLDSNLSQRIRHGTLAGKMRPLFEKSNLITQQDAAGTYIVNTHWISRLAPYSPQVQDDLQQLFDVLSHGVDALIAEVRNSWVQINSDANPVGYFDFTFSEEDLHSVMYDAVQSDDTDAFVSRVFDALWARTEHVLTCLRDALHNELLARCEALLESLSQGVEALIGVDAATELRDAVTSTRTAAQYTVSDICSWFHVDHPERMSAFATQALVDAITNTVKRYCGRAEIAVDICGDHDTHLPGRAFRGLWDLLFILLDNAIRHSGVSPAVIDMRVEHAGSRLVISVVNDLYVGVDRAVLSKKAEEMSGNFDKFADLTMSRREGGSGLYKVHKILRYDLDCKVYDVHCAVASDDKFDVTIVAELA